MARTPLLSRLQSLASDFAHADGAGRTVQALQEERRQNRLTRRDFLKAAGAAAGAAALSGTLPAFARAASAARVGIMGGGIAGLNAALTLQDRGIASTIFEASDRIGGRMHSLMSGYW